MVKVYLNGIGVDVNQIRYPYTQRRKKNCPP